MKLFSISLAPQVRREDAMRALALLAPWNWGKWRYGEHIGKATRKIEEELGSDHVYLFDKARSGLRMILESMDIGPRDEVIVQAFNCIVVPEAVMATGAKVVYADIDPETLNISLESLKKKISSRTRAVIVQHTFGVPAPVREIMSLSKSHGFWVIEDSAHGMGGSYSGKKLGTWGHAAIFSFGRDKALFCASGGSVVINDSALVEPFEGRIVKIPPMSRINIGRYLLYSAFIFWIREYYHWKGVRFLFFLAHKLRIFPSVYSWEEKNGMMGSAPKYSLPNALAFILFYQLESLKESNAHRVELSTIYRRELFGLALLRLPPDASRDQEPFYLLRYNIITQKAGDLRSYFRKKSLILGDWYGHVLFPNIGDVRLGYRAGECPRAEAAAGSCVNLPTCLSFSKKEAEKLAEDIKQYFYDRDSRNRR
ncbi:MAG: degt/dnrj/eryc1/strs aminotransferase [Parcubacteria group bacterium Gr01-1014_18]|nr:MAG: degt/dnrj/eryc1/strs aminotransferase [Parcubacteria group bacterium Greene0416_36]TSC81415.1 MAG: degt/dnrj/eryc1/strs aminotransferase [Parcubacteria group bacterium Gr01-1014_18]TSC99013.1 MAG: degt/dnrj/eryc1/strs aminotransferase [Parcubacteria group bacterium Greene1014_20]TSD07306.1 MAG: degt/dnrj/eryc1/strs aminotransferase [Parcubacteria group bacterium Greene0714_2]